MKVVTEDHAPRSMAEEGREAGFLKSEPCVVHTETKCLCHT